MTPHRVFSTYLWIAGLYSLAASLVWGINTLFLLAAGLDILGVFVVGATYTASVVLFEIPTGVVADTSGRRLSFILSLAALLAGTLIYVGAAQAGGGLMVFCIGALLTGLGTAFYSGAVEAWLVDALDGSDFQGALDPILAHGQMVTSALSLVGTVGGGLLATFDLSTPYLLRAALLLPLFAFAAIRMQDIGFAPRTFHLSTFHLEMKRQARSSMLYGWRQPTVRILVALGVLQYGFVVWAFHAWQPYFLELLGRDAPWIAGLVAALITLATLAGNALASRLVSTSLRRTDVLLGAAMVLTLGAVATGVADSFFMAAAALLTMTVAWGVIGPVKQAFLHRMLPSEQRATVISFDSLLSNIGGIGGQTSLGVVARLHGIADGYVAGGLVTILALPALWALRHRDESEDRVTTL